MKLTEPKLTPTISITEDGKTIYWYNIAQLEAYKEWISIRRIEESFKKNKHEDSID
jgi:hypothetical protein